MRSLFRHRTCHLAVCAALSIAADAAVAAPLPVTNCYDDGRAGSLRTVIAGAAKDDIIDLSGLPDSGVGCKTSRITLTQGQIAVNGTLTIVGPGQEKLAIDGNDASAIFYSSDNTATLTLRDIAVTNGHNPGKRGGCIDHMGSVVLDGAAVTHCTLDAYGSTGKYRPIFAGAGISASTVTLQNGASVSANTITKSDFTPGFVFGAGIATAYLYCTDSTISGNIAELSGAGGAYASAKADLKRCTVDNNIASKYAGGLSSHGAVTIAESTISHNSAGSAGGIYSTGTLTLSNSTVAFNYAGENYGSGIYSKQDITLISTIVADNLNKAGTPVDIKLATGKRILGNTSLVRYTSAMTNIGAIVSSAAPRLAPLGDRGGLTRTHAILAPSPAVDIGSNPSHDSTDQRDAARESPASKADIGAYERQPNDDELFYDGLDGT